MNVKNFLKLITSFSKIITIAWLAIWIETILFTQIATVCNFGDTSAIMYINDNVVQIGVIICGFYFCTKTVENVAKGFEQFSLTKHTSTPDEGAPSTFDDEEEEITEPEPVQNVEDLF